MVITECCATAENVQKGTSLAFKTRPKEPKHRKGHFDLSKIVQGFLLCDETKATDLLTSHNQALTIDKNVNEIRSDEDLHTLSKKMK